MDLWNNWTGEEIFDVHVTRCRCVWSVRWSSSEVFSWCRWPAGVTATVIVNATRDPVLRCAALSATRYSHSPYCIRQLYDVYISYRYISLGVCISCQLLIECFAFTRWWLGVLVNFTIVLHWTRWLLRWWLFVDSEWLGGVVEWLGHREFSSYCCTAR